MKNRIFLTAILLFCSIEITSALPLYFSTDNNLASMQTRYLRGSNFQAGFTNDGILNRDGLVYPLPGANRMWVVYSSGLWVMGKVNFPGSPELRSAVSFYNSVFSPGNIPAIGQVPPQSVCDDQVWNGYLVNLIDSTLVNGGVRTRTAGGQLFKILYSSWAEWPVTRGAPYVEVNGISGYQPGWNADRPGVGFGTVRPAEEYYAVYMDYTNCTDNVHNAEISLPGGTKPMGLEVQQLAYSFSCPGYEDSYFVRWVLINKSSYTWDSAYIGLVNDADIGNAADDAAGSDSTRDLMYVYNRTNNDNVYGAAPPAVGTRQIQGPLVTTGNYRDTVHTPYRDYVGYRMRHLASGVVFQNVSDPCIGDPDNALAGFNFMKGFDGCGRQFINPLTGLPTKFRYNGNGCGHSGWYDSMASDRRTLQSTGPLTMLSGDTQIVVIAFVVKRGADNIGSLCGVISRSDALNIAYYSGLCSSVVGLDPVSETVPAKFNLYQNYPNPFNPVTKIKFDIAGTGGSNVRLTIFDALGREVSTVVNEKLKPGTYETNWDGSNFTSGIYFVQLSTSSYTQTNKMVLIK